MESIHDLNKMDANRREGLIVAGMNEFCRGFNYASTDNIVTNANISKGLLFHYFGSKMGLFLYLIDYSCDVLKAEYEGFDFGQEDILERLYDISLHKMEVMKKYPSIFRFLIEYKDEPQVSSKILEVRRTFSDRVYRGFEPKYFRRSVDVESALEVIKLTLAGLGETFQAAFSADGEGAYDLIARSLNDCFLVLRKAFYRKKYIFRSKIIL